jgi:hypothetical protein
VLAFAPAAKISECAANIDADPKHISRSLQFRKPGDMPKACEFIVLAAMFRTWSKVRQSHRRDGTARAFTQRSKDSRALISVSNQSVAETRSTMDQWRAREV